MTQPTQAEFLAYAQSKVGLPYISDAGRFGNIAPEHYDCSGLVWAVCHHFGIPMATTTSSILQWGLDHHSRVDPSVAAHTPGGLLVRGGLHGYGALGHVVICRGDGVNTIEAAGRAWGVIDGKLSGGRLGSFQDGVLINGLPWFNSQPSPPPTDVSGLAQFIADCKKLVLRDGSTGPAVVLLQGLLTNEGFPLVKDGDFGNRTEDAVRSFQARARIGVDGVCGPQTWAALIPA